MIVFDALQRDRRAVPTEGPAILVAAAEERERANLVASQSGWTSLGTWPRAASRLSSPRRRLTLSLPRTTLDMLRASTSALRTALRTTATTTPRAAPASCPACALLVPRERHLSTAVPRRAPILDQTPTPAVHPAPIPPAPKAAAAPARKRTVRARKAALSLVSSSSSSSPSFLASRTHTDDFPLDAHADTWRGRAHPRAHGPARAQADPGRGAQQGVRRHELPPRVRRQGRQV